MAGRGCTELTTVGEVLLGTQITVLLSGAAYAAYSDWRDREVTDRLWQIMAIAGLVIGILALWGNGALPIVLWLLVSGLVLEHLFAWDEVLGPGVERWADLLEGVAYLLVGVVLLLSAFEFGLGPTGAPVIVLAVFFTVLFARALFEFGVLYGGADAKALMIVGIVLPIFATPVVAQTTAAATLLAVVPFSIAVLMDAALLSVVIPLGLAVRNLARREFTFPRGFSGYYLDVGDLPSRFVWVRDPAVPEDEVDTDAETSDEDRRQRERIAGELRAKGVARVWVTPQIPFLVVMAAGTVAALLAGNVVIDLLSLV